jgi:hypothetical protein
MSLTQTAVHNEGFEAGPEAAIAPERQVSSAERLQIAGELLAALDEATGPGRAHLMRRILGIVREEVLWPGLWLTGRRRAMVVATMDDLDREVMRRAPDLAEFRHRASGLLDLLSSGDLSRRSDRRTSEAASRRELVQGRS